MRVLAVKVYHNSCKCMQIKGDKGEILVTNVPYCLASYLNRFRISVLLPGMCTESKALFPVL